MSGYDPDRAGDRAGRTVPDRIVWEDRIDPLKVRPVSIIGQILVFLLLR